jgi:hypothetical protein
LNSQSSCLLTAEITGVCHHARQPREIFDNTLHCHCIYFRFKFLFVAVTEYFENESADAENQVSPCWSEVQVSTGRGGSTMAPQDLCKCLHGPHLQASIFKLTSPQWGAPEHKSVCFFLSPHCLFFLGCGTRSAGAGTDGFLLCFECVSPKFLCGNLSPQLIPRG